MVLVPRVGGYDPEVRSWSWYISPEGTGLLACATGDVVIAGPASFTGLQSFVPPRARGDFGARRSCVVSSPAEEREQEGFN